MNVGGNCYLLEDIFRSMLQDKMMECKYITEKEIRPLCSYRRSDNDIILGMIPTLMVIMHYFPESGQS